MKRKTLRVTRRRRGTWPIVFDIRFDGRVVGHAHQSEDGPGWYASGDGINLKNSWADGLRYQSVMDAAEAAVDYVKSELRKAQRR